MYKIYSPKETFEVLKLTDIQKHIPDCKTAIVAGGGLILDEWNRILVMKRRGKWDLPKGKIESNESIEEGSLREVEEECGLKDVTLEHLLTETFHVYEHKGQSILKHTYWYLMQGSSSEELIPQTEEDIEHLEWVSLEDLDQIYENTYPSIKDVITAYLEEQ